MGILNLAYTSLSCFSRLCTGMYCTYKNDMCIRKCDNESSSGHLLVYSGGFCLGAAAYAQTCRNYAFRMPAGSPSTTKGLSNGHVPNGIVGSPTSPDGVPKVASGSIMDGTSRISSGSGSASAPATPMSGFTPSGSLLSGTALTPLTSESMACLLHRIILFRSFSDCVSFAGPQIWSPLWHVIVLLRCKMQLL